MSESTPLSYADLRRFLLLVAGLYFGVQAARALAPILMLFTIVFFLAMVLNPVVVWLVDRGLKRGIATIMVMLGLIGVLVSIVFLVVPPMLKQVDDLVGQAPNYAASIQGRVASLEKRYPALGKVVPGFGDGHNAPVPASVSAPGSGIAAKMPPSAGPVKKSPFTPEFDAKLREFLNRNGPNFGHEVLGRTLKILGGIFFGVLTLLLTTFFLAHPEPIVTGFLAGVPERHREAAGRCLARLSQQMLAWIRATLINGLITGSLVGVLMLVIGVKPAFVFGVLAFSGEFVPSIGPVVMNVPALFVALGTGPSTFVMALVGVVVIQQIESNLLVPFIMGRNLELHPFVIIFFALSMGVLFGPIGAVLAVPTAVLVKILIDEFYTKPNAVPVEEISGRASKLITTREWSRARE